MRKFSISIVRGIEFAPGFCGVPCTGHGQNDATKNLTRRLVANKQLEFNLGGWCMPDEASPTYSAIIDLMTQGHQFILSEFGPDARPRTAWHVDP